MKSLSPLSMAQQIANDPTLDIDTKRQYISLIRSRLNAFQTVNAPIKSAPIAIAPASIVDPIEAILKHEQYYADAEKAERQSGGRGKKVKHVDRDKSNQVEKKVLTAWDKLNILIDSYSSLY